MPLYEYQCEQCQERVEILQRLSDPPYSHCPSCGGAMKKLVSAPAIQFKGSGWYKTDYASKPAAKSDTKSESKNEASESKPTNESKPQTETKTAGDKSTT